MKPLRPVEYQYRDNIYRQEMGEGKAWGSEVEMHEFTRQYNVIVHVYCGYIHEGKPGYLELFEIKQHDSRPNIPHIHILATGVSARDCKNLRSSENNHFVALIPTERYRGDK